MRVSDLFGSLAWGHGRADDLDGSEPSSGNEDLEARARAREAEWLAAHPDYKPVITGHYCFKCYGLVDHHETGDPMRPIMVVDRGTSRNHYTWTCWERSQKWLKRHQSKPPSVRDA